ENFESFAELLPEDFTPVYLGTNPSEKQLERGLSFEGKTNVKDLIALVSLMDFLISNDSGIIHIAAALGIGVGAIFGPTVPALGFTPFGSRHVIIENKDLKCRPCSLHGPRTCPKKHFKCMLDISPEDVLMQVKKFFE
ncbi:MAG: glycosyltransferase family 9 protein, partial [Elusimicrobia bacterium]|nr:glycosyltransferase family 9 protein [Elusimicrobiota bacterium]